MEEWLKKNPLDFLYILPSEKQLKEWFETCLWLEPMIRYTPSEYSTIIP